MMKQQTRTEFGWPQSMPVQGQKLREALFVCAFAGYGLLSFLPDWFNIDTRYVTIPYRGLTLFLACALIAQSLFRRYAVPKTAWRLFAIFWLMYSIRLMTDVMFSPASLTRRPEQYLLFGVGVCLVPAIAFFSPTGPETHRKIFLGLIWALFATCLLFVLFGTSGLGREISRLTANSAENPISSGHIGMSLALLCMLAITNVANKGLVIKVLAYSGIILGIYVVFLSASRGPAIAGLCAAMAVALTQRTGKARFRIAAIILLLALVGPYLLRQSESRGATMIERTLSVDSASGAEAEIRAELWSRAWEQFKQSPYLGSGLDLEGGGYPHDIVLEALIATGTFGGLMLIVIICYSGVNSLRLLWRHEEAAWAAALFIQYSIGALFSGTLYTNCEFWWLIATVCSAAGDSGEMGGEPLFTSGRHWRAKT